MTSRECDENRLKAAASSCLAMRSRDVVLGLGPWSLVVLKDKISVLGPGLGLEG